MSSEEYYAIRDHISREINENLLGFETKEEIDKITRDIFYELNKWRSKYKLSKFIAQSVESDSGLLDYLDSLTGSYSNKIILRDSTTGRGWRLHETSQYEGYSNVRDAILAYKKEKANNGKNL